MIQSILKEAKLLIFDLDGTLYEGDEHFEIYANFIKKHLKPNEQSEYEKIYLEVLKGNHPLLVGKVYDGQEDVIWTWDPFTEELTEARNWLNEIVQIKNAPTRLPVSSFDYQRWVPIGDGWWPPYVIGRHFHLNNDQMFGAYHDTKEEMAKKDTLLQATPGLKEYLSTLTENAILILMTNSEASDVARILELLELSHLFKERITFAEKPVRTKEHFTYLLEKYQATTDDAVSIGDNFMNEISPALQLGMTAVWLTRDQAPIKSQRLVTVKSLSNL